MSAARILTTLACLALLLPGPARAGDASVIPFPFLFYMPETKFGGGATVLVFLRGDDPEVRPSMISPILIYTAKRQTMLYLTGELYLDREAWRLDFVGGYSNYPDTFWGLGNDAPDAAEEDFTPRRALLNLSLKRRVAPALYVGGRFDFARRTMRESEAGGLLDTAAIPGVCDGNVVSAGLSVTHDDRDSTTFPRSGGFRDLILTVAGGGLGGDYDYRAFRLNAMHFHALSESSVLAAEIIAEARSDEPPFDMLGQLGGDTLLRGDYAGRYRDRNLLACQAEWRRHLWRRLGGVVFAGVGEVSRDIGDFTLNGLHAAGGFGIRFLLDEQEGLNLRADWGFGEGSSGFYLNLGEAF